MINLTQKELHIVQDILSSHLPGREVCVFGSRTGKDIKTYSDLDMVIMGPEPVDFEVLSLLREAFRESDLPFRVDVSVWRQMDKAFQDLIRPNMETLSRAG